MIKKLKRILMAALMCGVVSAGAFAQKQTPTPPPKDPPPHPIKPEPKDPPDRGKKP